MIAQLLNCSGNPFGKIAVFEVPNPKDHFYISNQQSVISNQKITYQYVSPVEYKVEVTNARKGDLIVFSESYDRNWQARNSEFKIWSGKFNGRLNSFILQKSGDYEFEVYYTIQDYVKLGLVISLLTLTVSLVTLLVLIKKK